MTIQTMPEARQALDRAEYKRAARRYGAAVALYIQTLDDIREEVFQYRWPSRDGIGIASLDARMLDAFKQAGLELRDLHPPHPEREAPLPEGERNGTEG